MTAGLVGEVAERFEQRQAEAQAAEVAAAQELAQRRALFRSTAAALAKGAPPRKGAASPAALESLLIALGLTPADLEAEVSRVAALIEEAAQADPPAAAAAEALARARHAVAVRRRGEVEREAKRAVEEAGAALLQAEGIARARRGTLSRLLDDVPHAAFTAYSEAQRALEVATARLGARMAPPRGVPPELVGVPVDVLEEEVKRASAKASAAWLKMINHIGEQ